MVSVIFKGVSGGALNKVLRGGAMITLRNRLKKFLCRNSCLVGEQSVLYPSAKIINALHDRDKVHIGNYSHIRGEILVFGHGGEVNIGDYCYVGQNTYIWSAQNIHIGNRVLISHNCNIFDNDTHPLDPQLRHEQFKEIITSVQPNQIDLKEEEVFIEDDVLIGANSSILKGVKIGNGAVVGIGSVVTNDVPSLSVVAGNPAKIINQV